MKTNIIAILALSALTLSPAIGAPRKMSKNDESKSSPPSAKSATEAPGESIPRKQAGARELVEALTTTQKSRLLTLLNGGSAEELAAIKGISTTRAAAIEDARPFEAIDEVILVRGIGTATMTEIVNHAPTLTATTQKKSSTSAPSTKKKP